MQLDLLTVAFLTIADVVIGFAIGWFVHARTGKNSIRRAEEKAREIVARAETDAAAVSKEKLSEVKDEWVASVVAAPSLSIGTYKNDGYGLGNDVGGVWTLTAEVSQDVVFVEFYLDNQLQLNSTATPFKWQFNTADYTLGEYSIKVVAYDSAGLTGTVEKEANFVEYSFTDTLVIIIVVVVVVMIVSLVGLLLKVNRKASKNTKTS